MAASSSEVEGPRQRDLVVVGAWAGGVEALGKLVANLPQELRGRLIDRYVSASWRF